MKARNTLQAVKEESNMRYIETLKQRTHDQLVNDLYNMRVSHLSDGNSDEENTIDKHGKRIPYIGWFWRSTDFIEKDITIGDCGDFVGVMENNKWGYAQRNMTTEEVDTFIEYLECIFAERDKGGDVEKMKADQEVIYNEMWHWFQTLRDNGEWQRAYS